MLLVPRPTVYINRLDFRAGKLHRFTGITDFYRLAPFADGPRRRNPWEKIWWNDPNLFYFHKKCFTIRFRESSPVEAFQWLNPVLPKVYLKHSVDLWVHIVHGAGLSIHNVGLDSREALSLESATLQRHHSISEEQRDIYEIQIGNQRKKFMSQWKKKKA